MGTIIGVLVGYVLGTQSGKEGWQETKAAWATIRQSEELRDLLAGGVSLARDSVGQVLRGNGVLGGSAPGAVRQAA
jgi:hypothetical protein